jgi:hypothetical protein
VLNNLKIETMKITMIMFFAFGLNCVFAQDVNPFFSKTDSFLKKNISNNKVDYQTIKSNPMLLNEIIDIAAKTDFSKESVAFQKAFLINAYNLFLIKGVVAKYPVKLSTDIPGLFDKTIYVIAGKKYTLNDIENKLIRAKFNDARVHFALVCGATGCPPITNFAYLPETIEQQLNKQAKLALNNPNFIKVNSKKVELSQIFEWYKADFTAKGNNEIEFINQFRDEKIDAKSKFSYYPYDWNLNKK